MTYRTPLAIGFIFLATIFMLGALASVSVPEVAAQGSGLSGPLVPCSGSECQACHLAQLAQNVINFLISVAVFLAVIMFAYAGFLMVTAAGNASKIQEGRGVFTNVLIGFLIALAAWLLIDTGMKVLFQPDAQSGSGGSPLYQQFADSVGPWNQIECVVQPPTSAGPTGQTGTTTGTGGTVGTPGCPNCVPVPASVAVCKPGANCNVDAAYVENLDQLTEYGLRITEGYPPTRTHQAACHSNGTCTDVTINDWSTGNIQAFQADAASAGYRAVYEPAAGGSCPAGVDCLDYSVTGSTGNHFSLYLDS